MKLAQKSIALSTLLLPGALAWGSLGHITVAYIATNLVKDDTTAFFQHILQNDTEHYLAGVATWADSIRYTKWGRFSKNFHFIDAKDTPPTYCGVDFERDCKEDGCVVSSIQNYTSQLLDTKLWPSRRNQAAKFVVHFVGDIHQPLHVENVAYGGNGIHVKWESSELNLHHVWDTSIAEKMLGGIHRKPYVAGLAWAANLTQQIKSGKYEAASKSWNNGLSFDDPIQTAMGWANESNAFVCSHVLPEGPKAIVGQELANDYYEKAAPVIELQVAKAGYRLATWLDLIAEKASGTVEPVDEL
ncbi:S1/P1 nuclease [Daldinia caldariorum]|uniref:S1/P1 nuclease n=1 Tax=Daldinia caldariorum TaxID=326644 RepID=UPI0020074939|nr:S1/P1 nuclease [Daldinia caldariorum]KAI1466514.1 S1/P1 nuclease [Daldinia caldariorum]